MSQLNYSHIKGFMPDLLSLHSEEAADWGHARNKRCVLMVPSAEWSQSAFSCHVDLNRKKFVVPNRDYPYEGLLVHQDGENWKFIDCVALALQHQDGRYLPFALDSSCSAIKLNPWRVTYCYKVTGTDIKSTLNDEISFFVSYYLHSKNTPEFITGCVEVYFPQGLTHGGARVYPVIQPFVDIRHMYSSSNFDTYRRWEDVQEGKYKRYHFSNYNRTLTFYLPLDVESAYFDWPEPLEVLHWHYKLGTGERTESFDHKTVFTSEDKEIAAFFNLRIPSTYRRKLVRLFFGCSLHDTTKQYFLYDIEKIFKESREHDNKQFQQMKALFPFPKNVEFCEAILARITGAIKFKTYIHLPETQEYVQMPHAGAWWFKTPWYRDVFEGILSNFETFMRIPEEKQNIKDIILLALGDQDETSGRIPNRIPEFKNCERSYNASDATLLCFIAANSYIQKTHDIDFAVRLLPHTMQLVSCFQKRNVERRKRHTPSSVWIDGPPIMEGTNGLLLSVPYHSWIDTRNQSVEYAGRRFDWLPNRASKKFIKKVYDHIDDKEILGTLFASPNFFLPEINAQWIKMLQGTIDTIELVINQQSQQHPRIESLRDFKETVHKIFLLAKKHFKKLFWNDQNGFLYSIVYENDLIRDDIECEAGVTASAMLGYSVFTREELSSIWNTVKKKLLVDRRLSRYGKDVLPFGILTKNDNQRIFYADAQYHSDVVWPKSTPYLIKLLTLLDEKSIT